MSNQRLTYIVTGASSGIGLGISQALLDQGYRVIGIGRDFTKVKLNCNEFIPLSIDLAMLEQLPQKFQQLQHDYPNIEGIICCAGQGLFGSLEEFSYSAIQSLMSVNFISQVYLIKTYIPVLKRQNAGKIIIVGSESALTGARYGSIYCASKFALRGFSESIRHETAKHNISISLVNPGMVRTDFFDQLDFEPGHKPNHALTVDHIVNLIMYILSLPPECCVNEVNLAPRQHVVQKRKPCDKK